MYFTLMIFLFYICFNWLALLYQSFIFFSSFLLLFLMVSHIQLPRHLCVSYRPLKPNMYQICTTLYLPLPLLTMLLKAETQDSSLVSPPPVPSASKLYLESFCFNLFVCCFPSQNCIIYTQ